MIKAVIFDMDDLMINSHLLHFRIIEKIMSKYDIDFKSSDKPLTKEDEAGFIGRTVTSVFEYLIKKYGIVGKVTAEELSARFRELVLSDLEKNVEPLPGLFELIRTLKGKFRLVVASSAVRDKIELVLRKLELAETFDEIVSGEEVKHSKPAPDIFLRAAQKIKTSPNDCLVLEDSAHGVTAAKAAGMHCIGVPNSLIYKKLGVKQDLSHADLVFKSLEDVTLETIKNMQ